MPAGKNKVEDIPSDEIPYPKSVGFIIVTEFCERFTFYGLRTVLTLFFIHMNMSKSDSIVVFHMFAFVAYFMPVIGAIIADSWLGKFRTILYLSIVYCLGSILLAVGSIPQSSGTMLVILYAGLLLIGVGTGGIKPCVSSFGGDQFLPGQEEHQVRFFSFFYMAINAGSLISMIVTPLLRRDVGCFGQDTCYPAAFGLPAVMMALALIIFVCGKKLYIVEHAKEQNVTLQMAKCICHAIGKKWSSKNVKRDHWLDFADDKFSAADINDARTLLHICVLFIPIPMFWALYDQQGSSWVIQALKMNGNTFGFNISPDQLQFVNPFLILVLVPLVDYCVYPCLAKCNLMTKPLQKIAVGGLIVAGSFLCAGFLELKLESSTPVPPRSGESEMYLINNSPCTVNFEGTQANRTLKPNENSVIKNLILGQSYTWTIAGVDCSLANEASVYEGVMNHVYNSFMITPRDGKMEGLLFEDEEPKISGNAKVRLFYNLKDSSSGLFILVGGSKKYELHPFGNSTDSIWATNYEEVDVGKYDLFLPSSESALNNTKSSGKVNLPNRGTYIISISQFAQNANSSVEINLHELAKPSDVHILLQLPQYFIISVGEILFSITGLEFSYSQASPRIKSVLSSVWLLAVAIGNLIVVIVAEASISRRASVEFFAFTGLMVADILLFSILAFFYKYANGNEDDPDEDADAESIKSESSQYNLIPVVFE